MVNKHICTVSLRFYLCACACVTSTGYFASSLPVSQVVLAYKAEMKRSSVTSSLSLLRVSDLDRKSEDLRPLLAAVVRLSYR